jgi:serine/threonine protein kinase/formylglycine-generating enzyme required for sulfatase activity
MTRPASNDEEPLFARDSSRFLVEEEIARGGMGVIYRVNDRSLSRVVAMKVCASRQPASADGRDASLDLSTARARFLEEAKITARLDHPGVVPVHELGACDDERPFFTMRFVRGRSLGEIFALARNGEEGWNSSRAITALIKVCQAVAYAHSKGIVHRDLKPANVMVGRFGEVYVLDWGLAKVVGEGAREERVDRCFAMGEEPSRTASTAPARTPVDGAESNLAPATGESSNSSPHATQVGTVLGTPSYMALEQAEGRSQEVDARADVHSLGAMLYELLAGEAPYTMPGSGISPAIVLEQVLRGPPRPVLSIEPKAPVELVAICEKAMARNPDHRYPSAFDLAEDLQAYLDRRVVSAYGTGVVATLRAWVARHRRLLGVAGVVAVSLTVVLVVVNRVTKSREAERLIESAREHVARHESLSRTIQELDSNWIALRIAHEDSTPAWHRDDELAAHRMLVAARRDLDARFNSAVVDFSNAARIAPGSELRSLSKRELAGLYLERYRDIAKGEEIVLSPEYYRREIEALDAALSRAALRPSGRITIESSPSGAAVYCFRYEEGEDTRLEPRPYDRGARRVVGEPFLKVASIVDPERHQSIFAVGDRLDEVAGRRVPTLRDLAGAIHGLAADTAVEVVIERRGSRLQRSWVPFPSNSSRNVPSGSLAVVHEQLGVVFEGYPLEFLDACRAGETSDSAPLEFELPVGSYLLVLRKAGYRDVRYPVVLPRRDRVDRVELVAESSIPDGFVYVPAGPFPYGGDRLAFQTLERGESDVPGFFIGRLELTVGEYLEFLNDLESAKRMDASGTIEPSSADSRAELAKLGEARIAVVPSRTSGEPILERGPNGLWGIPARLGNRLRPTSPVSAVNQLAAREYAEWRTTRDSRRSYRLPTDLEWEKAARGVDLRTHVWGDYLIWSFAWCAPALWSPHIPPSGGLFAADESVYGIRDLAGSMDEHTSSRLSGRYATRRGGNWFQSDQQNLRVATRNGRVVTGRGTETGFRLVCEISSHRANE